MPGWGWPPGGLGSHRRMSVDVSPWRLRAVTRLLPPEPATPWPHCLRWCQLQLSLSRLLWWLQFPAARIATNIAVSQLWLTVSCTLKRPSCYELLSWRVSPLLLLTQCGWCESLPLQTRGYHCQLSRPGSAQFPPAGPARRSHFGQHYPVSAWHQRPAPAEHSVTTESLHTPHPAVVQTQRPGTEDHRYMSVHEQWYQLIRVISVTSDHYHHFRVTLTEWLLWS